MNNSVFGKTMENIRNRVDIELVNNRNMAKKLTAKPNFKHLNIFCEDLVAIHMKKSSLTMNKPIYLGMSILDLSKTVMYDLHYKYIKPKYEDKAKLLFTDTDSLIYEIEVVCLWGFWSKLFTPILPHFFPPRTTFSQLGPLLKNCFSTHKNAFRYIIQHHHHIIYLTYTSKSFQLNSISYIHTKQSSHNIYI